MYSVLLDENDYFTGAYAEIGSVEGGVEVSELPSDMAKAKGYRLEGGQWLFDEARWEEVSNPPPTMNQLKAELAATDYKIVKCSEYLIAGLDMPYDVAQLHNQRQALRDAINELEETANPYPFKGIF